ncbi:class I adenylate-forming enzyme family protein [Psychrobacter arenosus]|uniref:class I adenylate-forming enzyme family protein n=1 Tax=Psychrobacter arenosus TaxID=256326 RepID=UPI001917D685|nr:class I adenylate-forming enzyme family protein [Psychrobacter arenosus]
MIVIPKERIAKYKEKGWWQEVTLDDIFKKHTADHPDTMALVDAPNTMELYGREPTRLTWQQSEERVMRYAAMFTRQGLKKDDVLIVQLPNIVDLSIVYLTCARLGIIVSPVPTLYRDNELKDIAQQVDAKAIITASCIGKYDHAALALRLQAASPMLEKVFCLGNVDDSTDVVAVEAELLNYTDDDAALVMDAANKANVSADEIFTICWTSGTESSPKGVPRSYNEWLSIARLISEANEVQSNANFLNPFPMVNMAGIGTCFFAWAINGGTLVQHHPFDLGLFIQQIRDEDITNTSAPPTLLNLLLQNDDMLKGINFDRLRTIGSGSAPLSEWMVTGYQEKYDVHITNLFGSNEGSALMSSYGVIADPVLRARYFPRFFAQSKDGSLTTDGFEARIVDPDTEEEILEAGVIGELRVKGPAVFSGYWRAPEVTARSFDADGWFKTGDLFQIAGEDKEFLEYFGRLKDVVIRGGMNISPVEIETLLMAYPPVADVAIVGAPDNIMGERVCAFIVPKKDQVVKLEAINNYLRDDKGVAIFKQVERLEIVDSLPRNAIGKVLKTALRDQLSK